ncbi:hypothetical protein VTN00DRAFT_2042 [Thermoascus crustaceus]|uniref:uncharacterized protein n=1 Tax=Thermoascus crustaceus TaxID=5088 RepID=UPI00374378C5
MKNMRDWNVGVTLKETHHLNFSLDFEHRYPGTGNPHDCRTAIFEFQTEPNVEGPALGRKEVLGNTVPPFRYQPPGFFQIFHTEELVFLSGVKATVAPLPCLIIKLHASLHRVEQSGEVHLTRSSLP